MHRERDGIALRKRDHFHARLHAWTLLGQDELAAREVSAGGGEQDRDLQRKYEFTVEILVKAVVIAGGVLQEQRRGIRLLRGMATLHVLDMRFGKHGFVC